MKKIIFLAVLIVVLFLISGAGCNKQKTNERVEINPEGSDIVVNEKSDSETIKGFEEGRVLVDRVRYVQAGNPPFDFTNVIFHNKKGNGYRAEINSDKNVKVEVMTDKDCILKGQGDKYNVIKKEEDGKDIVILGEKNEGESRNLCIGATAKGSGQIEVRFKVVELV